MFFLGVDGGGTKTAFAIISLRGQVLAHTITGTTHPNQIGFDAVRQTLTEGLQATCDKAGLSISDITYSVWGLPGFGENLTDARAFQIFIATLVNGEHFACVNDVEVGWAGSLACQPGLHLVAGTGAIGFGRDPLGQTARGSGWGEVFGDEGSAYWLGRKTLELFSKQADRRLSRTILYDLVKKHLSLERDLDLVAYIQEQDQRSSIAQIARITSEAARAGDEHALKLYEQAAYEHSLTFQSLLRQLDFSGCTPIPASYSGGVFNAGELILKPLQTLLDGNTLDLQKPILPPVLGACLYAIQKSGIVWEEDTVQALVESDIS